MHKWYVSKAYLISSSDNVLIDSNWFIIVGAIISGEVFLSILIYLSTIVIAMACTYLLTLPNTIPYSIILFYVIWSVKK